MNFLKHWAEMVEISELADKIAIAANSYYNSGNIILTDFEYDLLVDVLKQRSPNHEQLSKIGAIDPKEKVKLPYHMGSLDKIKNEKELSIWKDKFTANSVVVSEKLDGVSLEVVYENGNISLYTRGDGTYGRNISHILKYIEIPKPVANIAIRAEIIIPKSEFIPFYKESNNPESFNLRNCVSGLINRTKTAVPELKDAHVVAYEIIDSSSTMEEQLNNLQVMGFKVPKYVVLDQHEFTYKNLAELLAEWKEKSDYNLSLIHI